VLVHLARLIAGKPKEEEAGNTDTKGDRNSFMHKISPCLRWIKYFEKSMCMVPSDVKSVNFWLSFFYFIRKTYRRETGIGQA
jgi:hypothetical protein